jgi:hypothetical protein
MANVFPSWITPARLIVGIALNIAIQYVGFRQSHWSSIEREARLTFVAASLGAITLVFLIPVLWTGNGWQRIIALILIVFPCLTIFGVIEFVSTYQ